MENIGHFAEFLLKEKQNKTNKMIYTLENFQLDTTQDIDNKGSYFKKFATLNNTLLSTIV